MKEIIFRKTLLGRNYSLNRLDKEVFLPEGNIKMRREALIFL